jgi:two-component system OmpR family sensor kinase
MNRLWVRLVLAFGWVILVTTAVVGVLAYRTAGEAFRLYASYSGEAPADLVESLAAFYQTHGSWQGVETVLRWEWHQMPMAGWPMRGPRGFTFPEGSQLHIVLADMRGQVVYDVLDPRSDRQMTRDESAAAEDIVVNGEVVGRLAIALPTQSAIPGPLEQRFFDRLRQLLLVGGIIAGGVGLLLGLGLSRGLSAPLQRLATAARAVAAGDLSHRVAVSGSAEVAEVSQAFNEMAAGLEQAEQLRRNLMADVAHELRTPLTVLQGNLQAILDGVYPLDEAEVSVLYDETRLLSRLVDDVRELALAEAGKLNINIQVADPTSVLRGACDSLLATVQAQGINLTIQIPKNLPVVLADPDRVAQVLYNLSMNALQHTPSGGSIAVTAFATEKGLEVVVTDTGEGIAPEHLTHIFDRFWRVDPSRTRDKGWKDSSGLGLAIAQSLISVQGGRIWVESELGEGSAFHFTLPLAHSAG